MNARVLWCLLVVTLSGIGLGAESQSGSSVLTDDPLAAESFLQNPQFTVMVVKIIKADIVEGTHGSPPTGLLRVVEVLRGKLVKSGEYRYQILSSRTQEEEPDGNKAPLHGPRAGSELIVFAYLGEKPRAEGDTVFLQGPLIEAGQEQRAVVKDSLVHDSPVLLPLFLVVMISPLLGLLPRYGWLAPAVALTAYVAYETLMSPFYNIRVDVLLLWPALAASVVVPIITHVWRKRRRPAAN